MSQDGSVVTLFFRWGRSAMSSWRYSGLISTPSGVVWVNLAKGLPLREMVLAVVLMVTSPMESSGRRSPP